MRVANIKLMLVASGLRFIHTLNSFRPLKDKVCLLSRQSQNESLDFKMLETALRKTMPQVEVSVCTSDPETVDKRAFITSIFRMSKEVSESRVCILDGYIPSVSVPQLRRETQVIQIWHALGAIKKFGFQSLDTSSGRSSDEARILRMHANYDWVVAAGPGAVPAYAEAFRCPTERIVPVGLPRMDYLLDAAKDASVKLAHAEIVKEAPFLADGTYQVLYAPTLRKEPGSEGWLSHSVEAMARALAGMPCYLVVSGHPLDSGWDHALTQRYPNVRFIEHARSIDLIGLADAVITDYSALAFEAALSHVPVFFYVPDIAAYRTSPGLNIDPLKLFPDCAFKEASNLRTALERQRGDAANSFASFAHGYFDGVGYGSTERIAELIVQSFRQSKETES